MKQVQRFYATCPRGLESSLVEELNGLGASKVSRERGGVSFQGEWTIAYRANLRSRLAGRILWQVAKGEYRNETDLYQQASDLPWWDWFGTQQSFKIRVTSIESPLKSINFAALRVKDAICDAFRNQYDARPDVELVNPDVTLHLILRRKEFFLYIDTSGEALFKRGYRVKDVEAPLRENLAAGIIHLTGWKPDLPLLDPMCGSGTFLAEAGMMAVHRFPGLGRDFAFQQLLNFDSKLWQQELKTATNAQTDPKGLQLYGRDRESRAIETSRTNLKSIDLFKYVTLDKMDSAQGKAPAEKGIIVCNPPYGERLSDKKILKGVYERWGKRLKQDFGGWTAWILTSDEELPKGLGMTPGRVVNLFNGALAVKLYRFDIHPR